MAVIWYIGNQTTLDEDGKPDKYQTRYEEVNASWLRRRYDHYDDKGNLVEGRWHDIRRKMPADAGVYRNLLDEALAVSSKLEDESE